MLMVMILVWWWWCYCRLYWWKLHWYCLSDCLSKSLLLDFTELVPRRQNQWWVLNRDKEEIVCALVLHFSSCRCSFALRKIKNTTKYVPTFTPPVIWHTITICESTDPILFQITSPKPILQTNYMLNYTCLWSPFAFDDKESIKLPLQ